MFDSDHAVHCTGDFHREKQSWNHQASIKCSISSKAIRDFWKGRSWLDATYDLWSEEDRPAPQVIERPKGKKDSKSRVEGRARSGQDAHSSVVKRACSASRSVSMSASGYFDECRLDYALQFDAIRASETFQISQSFSFRK